MDSLKDFMYTLESCNHCGQCRFILGPKMRGWEFAEICPIHLRYQFDAYSGQGLLNIAQEMLEGTLSYGNGLVEHIYSCTTCGACDVNCKSVRDMEVMDAILSLRAKCVEDGQGLRVHREMADRVEKTHNIYGQSHNKRFDWLDAGATSDTSATAYFVGRSSAYRHPELALSIQKILEAGGISFRVLGPDEYCCGAPLWRTGQIEAAQKLAEHNLAVWRKQGIKTLITGCAECYGTFKGFYPRIAALDIEVRHISEVMAKLIEEGRLNFSRNMKMDVTYHDPCLLGRLSETYVPWEGVIQPYGYHNPPKQYRRGTYGVYDPPRQVLKAIPGIQLVEMTRNEENAFCCGAGGGVAEAFPEFAQWAANERLREARFIQAEALVSTCPFCQENFEKALAAGESVLRYYDLSELAAKAL